ncbi:MAG: GNAT family N-acetyltransferase [Pseudomonadota bacterium]
MPEVTIHRLSPDQAERFGAMTFPAYRHLLPLAPARRHQSDDDERLIQPVAVAASIDGQPVGLALAESPIGADREEHSAELLSLFVAKSFRRNGLGRALLAGIQQVLAEQGEPRVKAVFMRGKPSIDVVERLLAEAGWADPVPRMVTVKFMADRLAESTWIHRYKPRAGFEIFTWMDLKDSELEALRQSHAETGWIASDLLPWDYDQGEYEPITSVGMRHEGEVIGWVINHKLDAETVRYTCSFMHPKFQGVGGILPLYTESFRRLLRFGFKRGMFVAPLHHPRMAKFSRRWFGPYSYFTGETVGTEKVLVADTAGAEPA